MKTIAINEPTHKELKKLSEQAKMSMGDYMKEVALYFKRTGINPSTSDEQSPHKAIKVLDKRIEQVISFIKTMEQERLNPLLESLMRLTRDIGKTKLATTTLSNTDPAMLLFFMQWLALLGVPKDRLRVHVHLYADMNVEKEIRYWSKILKLPRSSFRKPYIKQSNRTDLTYVQKFTHGTCNIIFENRDVSEYVLQALGHVRSLFAVKDSV